MIIETINGVFDRVPRSRISVGKWQLRPFTTIALLAYASACSTSIVLAPSVGLARFAGGVMVVNSALTFLAVACISKIVSGGERYVQYHYLVAVMLSTLVLSCLLDWPVLAMLDLAALGLSTCLAVARIACLTVGCCHGQRARLCGIRYPETFVDEGFPAQLVGQRLIPVPLFESLGLTALLFGQFHVHGVEPGLSTSIYLAGYGLLRFGLEFMRGDCGRRHALGLSEAQWTAATVAFALALVWSTGRLPTVLATTAAAALVIAAASVIPVLSHAGRLESLRLGTPDHHRECEHIVASIARGGSLGHFEVFTTSCGIVLSGDAVVRDDHVDWCFTISGGTQPLRPSSVACLTRILADIIDHRGLIEIVIGRRDVVQLVMRGVGKGSMSWVQVDGG